MASNSPYTYPVTQGYGPTGYTSEPAYGPYPHFHQGVDYAAPAGTPVPALQGGTVIPNTSFGETGYGPFAVLVRTLSGNVDLYGHLSSSTVVPGQIVQPGQLLGTVGSLGNSSGPHLHVGELDSKGNPVDPSAVLSGDLSVAGKFTSGATAASGVAGIPVIGGIAGFASALFGDVVRVILAILAIISLFIGMYILFRPSDAPTITEAVGAAAKMAVA